MIVQSNTGRLFTVDPATGVARRIDLGTESVPNGDGVLLDGLTLYVVQNQLNVVAKIALRRGLSSGRVVRRVGDPLLDVPTTIDQHGTRLYAVNARFGTSPTATTEYWVNALAQVSKRPARDARVAQPVSLPCRGWPRSSADRAADFESACGGSTPPGAIERSLQRGTICCQDCRD